MCSDGYIYRISPLKHQSPPLAHTSGIRWSVAINVPSWTKPSFSSPSHALSPSSWWTYRDSTMAADTGTEPEWTTTTTNTTRATLRLWPKGDHSTDFHRAPTSPDTSTSVSRTLKSFWKQTIFVAILLKSNHYLDRRFWYEW